MDEHNFEHHDPAAARQPFRNAARLGAAPPLKPAKTKIQEGNVSNSARKLRHLSDSARPGMEESEVFVFVERPRP